MNTTLNTWTKWDDLWAIKVPAGSIPAVDLEADEWHYTITVTKRDGTTKEVSVCRTPEWGNEEVQIHHLSDNGREARKHQAAISKANYDDGLITRNGVTYAI